MFMSVLMDKRFISLICPIGQIHMVLHALIKFLKVKTVLIVFYARVVPERKKIIGVFIMRRSGQHNRHLFVMPFKMRQQEKYKQQRTWMRSQPTDDGGLV